MNKKRGLAAVLAAVLALSLTACGGASDETPETSTDDFGVAVQVQRVKAESISTENKVSGRVLAEDEATIMVGIAARCTAVYKDAGDTVKQGDILCKLDLGSTLSQYNASQISYESAIQSYNDQKALFDQQIAVAEKNVEVAERQIAVTQDQIAVNEKQIPVTENQIAVLEAQIPVVRQQIEAAEEQLAAGEAQVPVLEKQIALLEPQIALAEKNVSDTEALFRIGAASQVELDNAKIQADQAAFGRDQLQAQLTSTEAQLNSSRAQIEQSRYSIQQLQSQIDSSRFSVEQIRAQIEQAKFSLAQLELQRENAQLSVTQLRSTRTSTLSQLEAGIENARSGVQQLDSVLEDVDSEGNVIAPISGTLVTFNAEENGYVSNAMPVAVINGEDQMKVTASVSEALVPKLSIGDRADVYVSALSRTMTAEIRSVEQAANAQTRLYTVTLSLLDSTSDLLAGMFADVTFRTDRVENAIVVPSEAILTSGATQYVYIAVGDTAKYVEVTTGLTGVGVTEILSGLDGGEYLITVGQTYVSDGATVRIVSGDQ